MLKREKAYKCFVQDCGFRPANKENTVLQILFLSTGTEFYRDIFMKCLNFSSVDRLQMTLHIPIRNTKTEQKDLSLLG